MRYDLGPYILFGVILYQAKESGICTLKKNTLKLLYLMKVDTHFLADCDTAPSQIVCFYVPC